ncbi:hypothetical protein ES703_74381 [subsurface metagenome]
MKQWIGWMVSRQSYTQRHKFYAILFDQIQRENVPFFDRIVWILLLLSPLPPARHQLRFRRWQAGMKGRKRKPPAAEIVA